LTNPEASLPLAEPVLDGVCTRIEAYYTAKLARHGAIPLGVDWSCTATQWLRFVQLLKICSFETPFSLIDMGCGYGALVTFLKERHPQACVDYFGIDLSPAMVRCARRRYRREPAVRFAVGRRLPVQADYVVASGIMNVALGFPVLLWEDFIRLILTDMHSMSRHGFAVNFLAKPPRGGTSDQLYCSSPDKWLRFCREELACTVEVLDNYGMQEFTLLAHGAPSVQVRGGG
jgi:SAM-dependent methyltransferase